MARIRMAAYGEEASAKRRWGRFIVEAAWLVGLLWLFGRHGPSMPTWAVGLIWAGLSALSALGLAYHRVIVKARRQLELEDGGTISRMNRGRVLSLIVSFVVSAVLVAGLLLAVPSWTTLGWALAVASIPLYLAIAAVFGKVMRREFKPQFRMSRVVLCAGLATGALLVAVFLVAQWVRPPAVAYDTLADAFLAAEQPFAESPSTLLTEAGEYIALSGTLTQYAAAKAAQSVPMAHVLLQLLLYPSAFFGLASLLGTCMLRFSELKRVFLPLEGGSDPEFCPNAGPDLDPSLNSSLATGFDPCLNPNLVTSSDLGLSAGSGPNPGLDPALSSNPGLGLDPSLRPDASSDLSPNLGLSAGASSGLGPAPNPDPNKGALVSTGGISVLLPDGPDEPNGAAGPVDTREDGSSRQGEFIRRYVAVAVLLPVLLLAGFLAADAKAAQVVATQEYSVVKSFIREQMDLAVYVIDGRYYDERAVKNAVESAQVELMGLADETEKTVIPLVNAAFDARIDNVDEFLDWYYSLPADYERLLQMVTGSVEDYVADELTSHIEQDIDDSLLTEAIDGIAAQKDQIVAELSATIAEHEVVGYPEWIYTQVSPFDPDLLDGIPMASDELLNPGARAGVGALAGVGAGVAVNGSGKLLANRANAVAAKKAGEEVTEKVGKEVVEKVAGKSVFKVIVEKIGGKLAGRGASSVIGGAVGTLGGPVGTVLGAAVGTAVGFGVDYGLLKLDEAQNREGYRQEIVDAIEEARSETLAEIRAILPASWE